MNKGWSADYSSAWGSGYARKTQGQGSHNWFETQFSDSANIESEIWIMSVSLYETAEEGKQYCEEEGHDIKRKNLDI